MHTSSDVFGFDRRNLLWLIGISGALMLALLPFSSYAASLPFIQREWGMTAGESGMVFSGYLVGYAIASLFIVPLTDRYPARWVLLWSMVVMVVGNLLFAWLATDLWSGFLWRAVAGTGHVGAYIPAVRLVSERFASQSKGRAVGFFVSAGYAGTTLSYSFMGVLLGSVESWQMAYFLTACAGIVGLLLLCGVLLWESRVQAKPGADAPSAPARAGATGKGLLPNLAGFAVIRERAVLMNTLAYALHTAELYLARLWFPLLLGAAFVTGGQNPEQAAIDAATWSGPMFMMGMVGVFVGGYLSDRWGRTGAAVVIFGISGICSLVAGTLLYFPLLLLGLGYLYGFVTAADSAIYSTSILEIAPTGQTGAAQAVQSFIGFGVGAVVPVVAGLLLDQGATPQWHYAFGFNAMLAVGGVLALLALRRLPVAWQMADGKR